MLVNKIKVGKSIEEKIKMRNICCVLLIILGAASLYVGTQVTLPSGNSEYSSGYYVGLGCGLIVTAVITIIKNIRLLRNKEELEKRQVYEADERNIMIGLKAWSYAGYAMFLLLYVALLVAGAVNVVIMNTILVVLAVFVLCLFISRLILTKIM